MTAEIHELPQQPQSQSQQQRSLDDRLLDELERDDDQHAQRPKWWRDLLKRDEAFAAECLAREGNIRPFTFVAKGGVFTVGTNKKRTAFTQPVRVSGPLVVTAGARDEDGDGWSRQLEWLTREGGARSMPCLDELLQGDTTELARAFTRRGLHIDTAPHARFALMRYINNAVVPIRTLARSIGWLGDDTFILHDQVVGPREDLVLAPEVQSGDVGFGCGGTFAEWRRHVAAPLAGNPIPMFAMSVAFSGPVLALIPGAEAFGGTLYGETSRGKTTVLRAVASVWGSGAERGGFLLGWRATMNGLEGVLAARNDTVLVLDELGMAHARDVGEVVYACMNGVGKARANRDGSARRTKHWRVPIISSGERTLEGKLRESDQKVQGGQLARLATIPVGQRGAFVSIPEGTAAADFAKSLIEAAGTHFGHAGPLFVKWLVSHRDHAAARAHALMLAGLDSGTQHAPLTALAARVLHKMVTVGTAGELAIEAGVLPWPPSAAMTSAITVFGDWLEESERGGAPEVATLVRAVRHFIEIYGPTRAFTKLGEWPPIHADQPHDRDGEPDEAAIRHYGWKERKVLDAPSPERRLVDRRASRVSLAGQERRTVEDRREGVSAEITYLVKPEVLRDLAERVGFKMRAAVDELIRAELLMPGRGAEDRKRVTRRINGLTEHVYVIDPAK